MGINFSLEFKFFAMEIIFDNFFKMCSVDVFICSLGEKRERKKEGGDSFSLNNFISMLRSVSNL